MANDIRVPGSELQACAAEYAQSLQTLNEAVREYQQALNALKSDWTGRAAVIMSGNAAQLAVRIAELFERVTDGITELGEVEVLFNENESGLKARFANQDVGSKSPFGG